MWQGGEVTVNIHIGWTPKQAWPWQGLEQPFGYSGKSQPEARIPFNKYLWRLFSAEPLGPVL